VTKLEFAPPNASPRGSIFQEEPMRKRMGLVLFAALFA
jgi:hypothetical protein